MDNKLYLRSAVDIVGGQVAMAKRLTEITGRKITQSHVWNWLRRDPQVPAEMAIPIERATDGRIRRGDLRPDIYPADDAA